MFSWFWNTPKAVDGTRGLENDVTIVSLAKCGKEGVGLGFTDDLRRLDGAMAGARGLRLIVCHKNIGKWQQRRRKATRGIDFWRIFLEDLEKWEWMKTVFTGDIWNQRRDELSRLASSSVKLCLVGKLYILDSNRLVDQRGPLYCT
jgi:hypothetical protein